MSAPSEPLDATDRVVVIGGGQGGLQVATSLRERGFDGRVDLISEEAHLPYQRPPLSKDYLAGGGAHLVHLRDEESLRAIGVAVHTASHAATIDRERRELVLTSGGRIGYDRLILATGARARRPALPGAEDPGVLTLRTRDDADALIARLQGARHVVAIGGGFIGLEVASALRASGHDTTVVERGIRLMARSCAPLISDFMLARHREQGSDIRLDTGVHALIHDGGHRHRVVLDSGEEIDADIVLAAAGVIPNDELARDAGLLVDNGVVVDSQLATTDPAIFAIGDCAVFPSPHAGSRVRLESVQNAVDQAKALADHLVSGQSRPYERTPWFWSNQCGIRLQMVGLSGRHAVSETSGDPRTGKFSVLQFDQDRLTRAESVNDPATHLAARKILDTGLQVDRESVHRFDHDLKALVASMGPLATR